VADRDGSYKVLASTSSNTLEVYRVTLPTPSQRAAAVSTSASLSQFSLAKLSVLEMHGHRSDVRCVCVSSDGLSIATVSSEGVKIWSTKSFSCIRSCATGYGVSMTFITGNRYVLVGTKEGRIQVCLPSPPSLPVLLFLSSRLCRSWTRPSVSWWWTKRLMRDQCGQSPCNLPMAKHSCQEVLTKWSSFGTSRSAASSSASHLPPVPDPPVLSSALVPQVANGSLGIELSRQLMMTHDIMCVGYRYPLPSFPCSS
jgi:WD40 repeat protein